MLDQIILQSFEISFIYHFSYHSKLVIVRFPELVSIICNVVVNGYTQHIQVNNSSQYALPLVASV